MNLRVAQFLLIVMLFMPGPGPNPSTVSAADTPDEKVLFEEHFTAALGKDWSWFRELPDFHKLDRDRKEMLIRPVWSVGNLKNIPFLSAPDSHGSPLAIEVHIDHEARGDYEFASLLWYYDDDNYVDIRKGPHGEEGKVLNLRRLKAGKFETNTKLTYLEPSIDLRLVVVGSKAQGWYRTSSMEKWQSLGEIELPGSGPAKIGFRTGNGEGDMPTWARFSKFRILQLNP